MEEYLKKFSLVEIQQLSIPYQNTNGDLLRPTGKYRALLKKNDVYCLFSNSNMMHDASKFKEILPVMDF